MQEINTKLNITQQQKLTITPQLQNAIKLLQMNSIELVSKLESELSENPFLEELTEISQKKEKNENDIVKPLELEHEKKNNEKKDKEEIENYFADSSDLGYYSNYENKHRYTNEDIDTKQAYLEGAIPTTTTFYEDLVSQLRLMNISDEEFRIGEAIISSLDEDGYFKVPLSEIATSLNVSIEDVNKALFIVQKLEPTGVGARDLQECLLIQINQHKEKHPIAKEMIIRFLDNLLQQHRYKEIASKLNADKIKVTVEDIQKEAKFISTLEPYPARNYEKSKVKFVIPDVIIRKLEGEFKVTLNEEHIPKITLNKQYRKLISKSKDNINKNAKSYLDEKYTEAKLLLSSIEKRRSTISKVVHKILECQSEFFEKGPQYLKPLTLKDVAEKIEMSESTISRVTTDKYIDTPWGIYEFKYFFSSGIKGKTEKASTSIKELIKEIIENESNEKALTDDKIVNILSNRGIQIARRTVAKYRKALKIMPSYYRKTNDFEKK